MSWGQILFASWELQGGGGAEGGLGPAAYKGLQAGRGLGFIPVSLGGTSCLRERFHGAPTASPFPSPSWFPWVSSGALQHPAEPRSCTGVAHPLPGLRWSPWSEVQVLKAWGLQAVGPGKSLVRGTLVSSHGAVRNGMAPLALLRPRLWSPGPVCMCPGIVYQGPPEANQGRPGLSSSN